VVENALLLREYLATDGKGNYTVAARMYGEYRGKRLATPFLEVTHREFVISIGEDRIASIVALIHEENIPSQRLFAKLGYQLF